MGTFYKKKTKQKKKEYPYAEMYLKLQFMGVSCRDLLGLAGTCRSYREH
jgi:hypothetical protein